MPFSLFVRRDHLIQHTFSPSHCTITCRRSPHELRYHISSEITASIGTLYLVGCMYPLPIRSYSLTRDLAKTRYGLLGSLTPEPCFVNDPTPILHLTHERESVCLFFVMWHPIFHLFHTPLDSHCHSIPETVTSIFSILHNPVPLWLLLHSSLSSMYARVHT